MNIDPRNGMLFRFCVVLLILVAFSGCSRDKAKDESELAKKGVQEGGSFEVNACSLMTQKEGEELLGEKLQSPREDQHLTGESTRAAMSLCIYPYESGKTITIFYRKSPASENTPESIQAAKNTASAAGSKIEEVRGVGDNAFWAANELHVFHGDRSYLIVTVNGIPDADQSLDSAKKAAEIAIRRT